MICPPVYLNIMEIILNSFRFFALGNRLKLNIFVKCRYFFFKVFSTTLEGIKN